MALVAERDENTCRAPLTASELAKVVRRLRDIEAPKARERQAATGTALGVPNNASPKLGEALGRTDEKIASAVGKSARTIHKMLSCDDATTADPEKYGDLPGMMDSKSVDAAYRVKAKHVKRV